MRIYQSKSNRIMSQAINLPSLLGLCLSIIGIPINQPLFHGIAFFRGPHDCAWEILVIGYELTYNYIYIYCISMISTIQPPCSAWVPHGAPTPLGPWDFPRKSLQFDTKFGLSKTRAQFIGYSHIIIYPTVFFQCIVIPKKI